MYMTLYVSKESSLPTYLSINNITSYVTKHSLACHMFQVSLLCVLYYIMPCDYILVYYVTMFT